MKWPGSDLAIDGVLLLGVLAFGVSFIGYHGETGEGASQGIARLKAGTALRQGYGTRDALPFSPGAELAEGDAVFVASDGNAVLELFSGESAEAIAGSVLVFRRPMLEGVLPFRVLAGSVRLGGQSLQAPGRGALPGP